MAVKNYGIFDKWLNSEQQNVVDVKSTDGVINSVKVNGQEYGGGGSSDFSTAKVTVTRAQVLKTVAMPFIVDGEHSAILGFVSDSGEYTAVLYKGVCVATALNLENPMLTPTVAVTGNAEADGSDIIITGDCTITVS